MEHQQGLTAEVAAGLVRRNDRETAARVKLLYHVDWDDPLLYHLVLNTEGLDVKAGAGIIQEALRHERFQPTTDALGEVRDLSLIARAADKALELAGAFGERGFEAHALHVLGAISAAGDARDLDSAFSFCERARAAIAMLRDMDMRYWLEQAEAELKQLG